MFQTEIQCSFQVHAGFFNSSVLVRDIHWWLAKIFLLIIWIELNSILAILLFYSYLWNISKTCGCYLYVKFVKMCVCVCVCVCVCSRICVSVLLFEKIKYQGFIYVYRRVYIRMVGIYLCIYVCVYAYLSVCMCTCVRVCIFENILKRF